jgi:hypothetical protein
VYFTTVYLFDLVGHLQEHKLAVHSRSLQVNCYCRVLIRCVLCNHVCVPLLDVISCMSVKCSSRLSLRIRPPKSVTSNTEGKNKIET